MLLDPLIAALKNWVDPDGVSLEDGVLVGIKFEEDELGKGGEPETEYE